MNEASSDHDTSSPGQGPGSTRLRAAEQNRARLAALAAAPPGLIVAAIASEGIDASGRGLPSAESHATAIAELPGLVVWAWASTEAPLTVAHDLEAAQKTLGEGTRVVLVLRPRGRVVAPPLHGEVGAVVEAVDTVPLVRAVGGLSEGELVRGVDVVWSEAAQARLDAAGFLAPAPNG